MIRLTERQVEALAARLSEAAQGGPETWDVVHPHYEVPARLEFPLGEIMNQRIGGFIMAWRWLGKLGAPQRIEEGDRFNAQGLEGKLVVDDLTLVSAILAAQGLPPYRRAVYVDAASYRAVLGAEDGEETT